LKNVSLRLWYVDHFKLTLIVLGRIIVRKLQMLLYVGSIIVAVGIGMTQTSRNVSYLQTGSIDCPKVELLSCTDFNPNCSLNYQITGDNGSKMVWAENIIRCNEPLYPACNIGEGPAYVSDPVCDE
jgi:hypothetical protein